MLSQPSSMHLIIINTIASMDRSRISEAQNSSIHHLPFRKQERESSLTFCMLFEAIHNKDKRADTLIRPDGKVADPHWQESSTAGIRHRSLEDAPGYVPPEDFIDPDDSTTGKSHISPTFDESTARGVTTQLGQTAYLHCIVNNLGDKTIKLLNPEPSPFLNKYILQERQCSKTLPDKTVREYQQGLSQLSKMASCIRGGNSL
ncbi:hypothetical protein CEXT_235391 [Caerostris extrusa]|uniref:Uncharacterized protein n=1 Tax=Caerostris extrusa TaxID=172846 RepID=A0AAV4X6A9_CAEEX|nr:hypothetical protein CEXT_235391 [Caerostris extrusa]